MNEEINKIIVKFLTNGASEKELEEFACWLNNKENANYFDYYIKINYALNINMNEFDSKRVKETLMKKIQHDKNLFYKLKIYNFIKYAAVAIVFLGMGYFYQQYFFTNDKEFTAPTENITIQLENGDIEIVDEDGFSKIMDAQGNVLGTQSGTQLVYNNDNNLDSLVYNTLTVPYGKRSKVYLSDGTEVHLNAGTSLKFPVKFIEGKAREVFLDGEAFFDVAKDPKNMFVVNTDNLKTTVYGTSFNLNSYKNDMNITNTVVLVSGSLGVSNIQKDNGYEVLLKPNEKVSLNSNRNLVKTAVNVEDYIAWIDGKLVFNNRTMQSILKILERHYNVSIQNNYTAINKSRYTGSFEKETIEDILKAFSKNTSFTFRRSNNQIIINP